MVKNRRSETDSSAARQPSQDGRVALIRPRLTESKWHEPILLIEAPAGYGKSLLTHQLLRATPRGTKSIAIALGDEHRDPGVLLAELIVQLSDGSRRSVDPASDPADLFLRVVKRLEEASRRIRLFFDDVHRLSGSTTMHYLNRLLGGAGPALQFVLASREFDDSDLSIAELTGRGLVRWLGTTALALTEEESLQLARLRGGGWSEEQISALARVTQGWPVLLQLALSGTPSELDENQFAMADSIPVRRYIEDRFLSGLDDEQTRLLAVMSCDDDVPMALLEAMDNPVSQRAIRSLEGLGIVQRLHLSNGLEALSIHPVLGESVLRSATPTVLNNLNVLRRQAAAWWLGRGETRRAVRLMIDAGDREQACQWLLDVAEDMVFQGGHHQTFLDLVMRCEPLPPQHKDVLEKYAVWALIFQRRHAEAEIRLKSTGAVSADTEGEIILQRAAIAAMQDDYATAASFAVDWSTHHTGNEFHRGVARVVLAFNQKCESNFEDAVRNLAEARELFTKVHSGYGLAWAYVVSLLTLLKSGRHREARAEICTSLKSMDGEDGPSSQRAMLLGIQALLHYERNELSQAQAALEDCLPLLPEQGVVDAIVCGYMAAARLRCADGDLGTALDLLAEGENIGKQRGFPRLSKAIAAERVMSLLRAGAIDQAESAARLAGLVPSSNTPFEQDRGGRIFARLALLRGEPRQALELITPMEQHARETGQQFKLCECLLLEAIANYDLGDSEQALTQLQQAFRLGELEGYFRVYYDELQLLSPLLDVYNTKYSGQRSPIAKRLRETATDVSGVPIEFSTREKQIISLLSEGLSNANIAARCFLGEGTVKWHLHNIYGKLDVGSRTAAVHAAQRLGIS